LGYEPLSAIKLIDFARARNPSTNQEWAQAYADLCPIAGIRTSIAFAQAIHETGWFVFAGTAHESWNNPAGLGVTGPTGVGNRFATRRDGVRAHLGHLAWYFGPYHPVPGFCEMDQRHFGLLGGHKHLENDVRQLGGRWAPSPGYGIRVAQLVDELMG
jgi:N-acetylmuramoyl-L-alanine amidase